MKQPYSFRDGSYTPPLKELLLLCLGELQGLPDLPSVVADEVPKSFPALITSGSVLPPAPSIDGQVERSSGTATSSSYDHSASSVVWWCGWGRDVAPYPFLPATELTLPLTNYNTQESRFCSSSRQHIPVV